MIQDVNFGAFPTANEQPIILTKPFSDKQGLVFSFISANPLCIDAKMSEVIDLAQRNIGSMPNLATYNEPGGYIALDGINQNIILPSWDSTSNRAKFTISIKFSHRIGNSAWIFACSNEIAPHAFGVYFDTSASIPRVTFQAGGVQKTIAYSSLAIGNTPCVASLTVDRAKAIAHYRIDGAGAAGIKNINGSIAPGSNTTFVQNTINGLANGTRILGFRLYSLVVVEDYLPPDQLYQLHRRVVDAGIPLENIIF